MQALSAPRRRARHSGPVALSRRLPGGVRRRYPGAARDALLKMVPPHLEGQLKTAIAVVAGHSPMRGVAAAQEDLLFSAHEICRAAGEEHAGGRSRHARGPGAVGGQLERG